MDNANLDIEPIETETKAKKQPFKKALSVFDNLIKNEKDADTGSSGFKSLGTIVKVIAFFVAFAVIGIHIFAAYLLFAFRPLYASICIIIVTFGLVLALIVLFLIYALGHTIDQNNEIIDLLKRDNK